MDILKAIFNKDMAIGLFVGFIICGLDELRYSEGTGIRPVTSNSIPMNSLVGVLSLVGYSKSTDEVDNRPKM